MIFPRSRHSVIRASLPTWSSIVRRCHAYWLWCDRESPTFRAMIRTPPSVSRESRKRRITRVAGPPHEYEIGKQDPPVPCCHWVLLSSSLLIIPRSDRRVILSAAGAKDLLLGPSLRAPAARCAERSEGMTSAGRSVRRKTVEVAVLPNRRPNQPRERRECRLRSVQPEPKVRVVIGR